MSKQICLQIYLLCLTIGIAWLLYAPRFPLSELFWMVPVFVGTGFLQKGYGKSCSWVGFGVFVVAGPLSILIHFRSRLYDDRLINPTIPSYLMSYEFESRGVLRVPETPDGIDTHPLALCWIHAPEHEVKKTLMESESKGRGFDTADNEAAIHVNFTTGESWNVYTGQRTIPRFPALTGSTVQPGTESTWCTLAYQPPYR